MVDVEKNSQHQLELPPEPLPPELEAQLLGAPVEKPKDTPLQGGLKEAKRLAKLSGTFGVATGLMLAVFTHLVTFWLTGQMGGSVVVNVVIYAAVLGLIGVAFGGLVGLANGAFKAWWAGRKG